MNKSFALKMCVYFRVFVLALAVPAMAQADLTEKLSFQPGGAGTPNKCGFPVVLEAAASADASVQALLKQRRSQHLQQNYQTYLSPLGRFRIHYLTAGPNAIPTYDRNQNGVSDYLEFVAKSFDRAWEVEIDSLGFNAPPDSAGLPHTVYSVYCKRINAYGITWFSDPLPAPPGVLRYDSYIEINTDFSFVTYPDITNDPIVRDSLAIAVTAAHEFNHASQLGYRIWFESPNFIDLWFIESSATYMEEVVADRVNDYYYYLPCMYSSTDVNLTQNNPCNRIYGEVALPIMLGEVYGKTITREVWEAILNQPALGSLSLILQQKGSSLNAEMRRWATWMFFSGQNAVAGQFYPEAAKYPDPEVITLGSVSLIQNPDTVAVTENLPPLAFHFLKIPILSTGRVFLLLGPQQNTASWFGSQFLFSDPYLYDFAAGVTTPVAYTPPSGDLNMAVISGDWNGGQPFTPNYYSIVLQGPLIGLDFFKAVNIYYPITLKWATIFESDNEAFIIDKSIDGHTFDPLIEIAGQGNSNLYHEYTYVDTQVVNGNLYYYRLSNRDSQGTITIHDTLLIKTSDDEMPVGPNPVRMNEGTDRVIFLNLPRETTIEIFNANGQRVATVRPESSGQVAYWDLRSSQNELVGSGVYIYRIVSPEKSQSGKIMVIR